MKLLLREAIEAACVVADAPWPLPERVAALDLLAAKVALLRSEQDLPEVGPTKCDVAIRRLGA